jgi:outer membrane protein assembly factor BamE (lipoprotein component of BamABCDE complex)
MDTRRAAPLLLIALAAALAPGCLVSRDTFNQPFDPAKLEQLAPGTTTAEQAAELLGAPHEVVQLGRRSAWRYDFQISKRAALVLVLVNFNNTDTRSDRVWLFFDDQDVLSHYGSSFDARNAKYSMPWQKPNDRPAKDEPMDGEPAADEPDGTEPDEP